jgi:hypothetical protein
MQRDVSRPDTSTWVTRVTRDPGSAWLFQFLSMGMTSMQLKSICKYYASRSKCEG